MTGMLVAVLVVVAGMCAGLPGASIYPMPHQIARRQAPTPVTLADLIQEFGLDLTAEVQENGNLAVSPLSVAVLLSSLMLGTVGASNTELHDVLYLPPAANEAAVHRHFQQLVGSLTDTGPNVTVNVANGLFLRAGVEVQAEYTQKAREHYSTEVRILDFNKASATRDVNKWVQKRTDGMIPNLLTQPLSPQTVFFAVNTVFFNGAWAKSFQTSATTMKIFQTGTESLQVPMMTGIIPASYIDLPDMTAHMIAIPYVGGQFAMFILMRTGSVSTNPQDLQTLEYELNARTLNNIINNMTQLSMLVELPRMRLSYKTSLRDTLQGLGATTIFRPRQARFDRLTTQQEVWVDDVIHETVVEVSESGTRAASATGAGLNRIGSSKSFRVNRPAIFFIRDLRSGLPLFWGRVVKPEPLSHTG